MFYQAWGLIAVIVLCLTPLWLHLAENNYDEADSWDDYGPIIVKTTKAAFYTVSDQIIDPFTINNPNVSVAVLTDDTYLIVNRVGLNEVYISFQEKDGMVGTNTSVRGASGNEGRRLLQDDDSSTSSSSDKTASWASNTTTIPFLKQYVPYARAPAPVVDVFNAAVGSIDDTGAFQAGPLTEAVLEVMGNERLLHITCTGEGAAGGLAILCGVFSSMAFPEETFVDVITFGTPWSGFNSQFAYFFDNVVDLFYVWPFNTEGITAEDLKNFDWGNATATLKLATTIYEHMSREIVKQAVTLPNTPPPVPPNAPPLDSTNVDLSDGDYETEVNDCYESYQGISLYADPEGVCKKGTPVIMSLGNLGSKPDFPPENQPPSSACPPVICKTWEYLDKSCIAFTDTVVLGGLPYTEVNDGQGANSIITWNDTSKELTILWKYTEEGRDWITDANVILTDNLRRAVERAHGRNIIDRLFDDPEVHLGFYNQFESLSIKGTGVKNLTEQIYKLNGNQEPLFVKISGFSLGGALSEYSAVWAAYEWPKAHVYAITQGAPKVGTADFLTWFKASVGRVYRYVYNMDEVPAIPPFDNYLMTRRQIWITREGADGPVQVLLTDRPPTQTKMTTWYDHWCEVFYVPLLRNATKISIPQYVHSLE